MSDATLLKFGHPETLVGQTSHWMVLLRPQQVTLGALVLICREPVTRFAAASPAAFANLHGAVGRIESMLTAFVNYEKLNYLMLMMVDPDVHFHVIPRYAGTRAWGGIDFPDAGWPGPPALAQAIEPRDGLRASLVTRLREGWGAHAA